MGSNGRWGKNIGMPSHKRPSNRKHPSESLAMNENEQFNRRDFLKGGSVATLMTVLGSGVEVFAQTNTSAGGEKKPAGPKVKIGVIGLGTWGREIVNTLARQEQAEIAAICDTYPAFLRRS